MNDEYIDPLEAVTSAQLRRSAKVLKNISEIQDREATMDDIVASLEQTMVESQALAPKTMCDIIAVQSRVLDAAFHMEMDRVMQNSAHLDQAIRLQKQTLRSMMTWKLLKTDIYVRYKTIEIQRLEKMRAERTEQKRDGDF